MLPEWFEILREARRIAAEKREARKDADERAAIAKAFNDRYTYRRVWKQGMGRMDKGSAMYGIMPPAGHAWMCPECNHIHHPVESSAFTGLQYPKCCRHREGHRLDDEIRTG